jgi:integrase
MSTQLSKSGKPLGAIKDYQGLRRLQNDMVQARYRDEDGRFHTKVFKGVREAQKWRGSQIASKDRGEHVAPSRITVIDYALQYVEGRSHRPATTKTMKTYLTSLEGDAIGHLLLSRVLPTHIDAWRKRLEGRYARTSVTNRYGWLRSVFSAAVEDRYIARSPFTSRTRPNNRNAEPRRVVPMSVEEVQRLTDVMPKRYQALVVLMAGTGLRLGEALGLRLTDVDWLRHEVHVRGQLARSSHVFTEKTKTVGSRRTVPCPDHVLRMLSAHLREFGEGMGGGLWRAEEGGGFRHDMVQRAVTGAARRADMEGRSAVDMRHHYASTLLAANVDVFKVAAALGHTTPRLVLTTYGHLVPDGGSQVRTAIEGAWHRVISVSSDTVTGTGG